MQRVEFKVLKKFYDNQDNIKRLPNEHFFADIERAKYMLEKIPKYLEIVSIRKC